MTDQRPVTAIMDNPGEALICATCGITKTDADPNCDCSLTSGRCEDCDAALTEATTFMHKGFEFCTNCISAIASWYLDGGEADDPELFAYLGETGDNGSYQESTHND